MASYDKEKRFDKQGNRWHFVSKSVFETSTAYEDAPFVLYFRNDERTIFGVLQFAHRKDNPYRDYGTMVYKIMNDAQFRESLIST